MYSGLCSRTLAWAEPCGCRHEHTWKGVYIYTYIIATTTKRSDINSNSFQSSFLSSSILSLQHFQFIIYYLSTLSFLTLSLLARIIYTTVGPCIPFSRLSIWTCISDLPGCDDHLEPQRCWPLSKSFPPSSSIFRASDFTIFTRMLSPEIVLNSPLSVLSKSHCEERWHSPMRWMWNESFGWLTVFIGGACLRLSDRPINPHYGHSIWLLKPPSTCWRLLGQSLLNLQLEDPVQKHTWKSSRTWIGK